MAIKKKDAVQILDHMISRDQPDLIALMERYGQPVPQGYNLTPVDITDAAVAINDPGFEEGLYQIYNKNCMCDKQPVERKTLYNEDGGTNASQNKFQDFLSIAAKYLSGASTIATAADHAANDTTAATSGTTPPAAAPEKRIMGLSSWVFWSLLVAVVLMIGFIIYIKTKK